ncbi:hypothetical protein GEOBRER4_n2070 [Citrifermentans bremense]|uniref:Uncharacterized protein n=1 Tax=Citrifermentans bremense TaxID=60035 RepID=A0A7R7FS76_9BACT|nr:hypothetical protein GEOBRER4_n2070 [Citrifermentans bremense]
MYGLTLRNISFLLDVKAAAAKKLLFAAGSTGLNLHSQLPFIYQ